MNNCLDVVIFQFMIAVQNTHSYILRWIAAGVRQRNISRDHPLRVHSTIRKRIYSLEKQCRARSSPPDHRGAGIAAGRAGRSAKSHRSRIDRVRHRLNARRRVGEISDVDRGDWRQLTWTPADAVNRLLYWRLCLLLQMLPSRTV